MALRIVGTGFGRTGTKSFKRALESLGYGPFYHIKSYGIMPRDLTCGPLLRGEFCQTETFYSASTKQQLTGHLPDFDDKLQIFIRKLE